MWINLQFQPSDLSWTTLIPLSLSQLITNLLSPIELQKSQQTRPCSTSQLSSPSLIVSNRGTSGERQESLSLSLLGDRA